MSTATLPVWLPQGVVAAVWLWEGFWCKVLGRNRHEFDVVEQVPGVSRALLHDLLRLLGVVETLLGLWVLSGWWPITAALVQTGLLVGLNSAGIYFSGQRIPDPVGMVLKNAALLLLAWVVALQLAASP